MLAGEHTITRVAIEAIESTALLGEKFKDSGVLSITSSDKLFHEWKNQNKKGC